MTIHVDTRWDGAHGIARYAREVVARLTVPWQALPFDGSPSSPADALRRLPQDARSGLVYSPGYNAFTRARRQVLTLHDLIHLQTDWPGRAKYLAYYNLVVRPVVRRTGVVLTVSETSRQIVRDWLHDDSVDVVNAGIGASADFTPDVTPADSDAPYLMYVGNLRRHKNVTVVLDALTRVPDARLRILIPASEQDELRALVAERSLEQRVTPLGRIDDAALAAEYRGAAATVMPSTLEGFGLPALESVMTGTPVLYWQGCAAVAETAAGRGRAVAEAHDAQEWAAAIEDALAHPRRVDAPVGRYSWDETARMVDEVLRDASGR
ncbi:glycosyltransferase family 1 protein [Microbacterium paludicola]|uniref:glycosyltransferase family 4 protein n=1 Tax=Microbacterium paludicola TaxID=300019 RepID=UPI0031CFD37D